MAIYEPVIIDRSSYKGVTGIDFDTNHSSSCPKYLDSLLLQFTTTKCVLFT